MVHTCACALVLAALVRAVAGSTFLRRDSDHHSAAELSDAELLAELQRRKLPVPANPAAVHLLSHTKLNISKASIAKAISATKKLAVMPIEDQLLGMTEEMKVAMYGEMTITGGPVSQAINFVRSHPNEGWTWCANDGQTCYCNGQVRFGSHAGGWPSFTGPFPVAGQVVCNQVNFGATMPARHGFHCQCSDISEKQWQNTKLRYNSVSYLQEAWITMTRVMAQAKLLPVSGDKLWGGEALFSVRGGGSHDRTFMDIFLRETMQFLPQTPSNCLEWAPAMYMPSFPACATGKQFSLDYEEDMTKFHVDANNHIHCDNVHLPQCLGATKIDIALNTNVWEHEIEPFSAMQSLYDQMNLGGVMLFTVPFVAPYHGVPYDFYRYTKSGVTHVLERAGFCVPRSQMASGGDFITDISLMAGVGPGDFSQAEIQQAYHRGHDNIPDGATVMMAVAYKKWDPSHPCPP
jgi:hypothetical protein